MGKRLTLLAALVIALALPAGCLTGSQINSYLLEDANVGGDPGKSLKPIKSLLVWPLDNIATGAKSKGVETRYSGILIDTLNLRGGFDLVIILEEDQAKDLMARAGEELGLKKKPKTPLDGALIATKLGQLTGTESILLGRLEDYDEDKVDKATITVVSSSFNLLDAREKAYAAIDSFSPVKRVWRTHVKRTSKEGPFSNRESIDDAARGMIRDVVDRLAADLGQGAAISGRALDKKAAEIGAVAQKSLDAGEYDKALAGWNEVLKFQPDNKEAKRGIEETEQRKRQSQEKAAATAKQIEEYKANALAAEKAGDLERAAAEWKKVLDLDKKNEEVIKKVVALEKQNAERKAATEKKAEPAKPEPKTEPKAEPAKPEPKVEQKAEPKAETPKSGPRSEPKAEAPKAVEKKAEDAKPAAAPAASGTEALRNQAMAAFNKEDYAASRDLWRKILESVPDDKQAKEMLETTEMLLNALK